MPSMSFGRNPQSAIAFSAASACSWICERLGMTPSFVVSAAPTTVTAFCRIGSVLCRAELGQADIVVLFLEYDFQGHVELQGLRRLWAVDDIGHHARALGQLHHGDRIGRVETRHL